MSHGGDRSERDPELMNPGRFRGTLSGQGEVGEVVEVGGRMDGGVGGGMAKMAKSGVVGC